jgi:hypothetical protein
MPAEIEHLAFVSTVSQRAGGVGPRADEVSWSWTRGDPPMPE